MSNKFMSAKNLNLIPIEELIPYENNPRKHGDKSISAICEAIEKHGFTNPIVTDQKNRIIAGHGRLLAAKKLGLKKVPCVAIHVESEKDYISMVLSDNKVAEFSKWDNELLTLTMDILRGPDIEFDLPPGFSTKEIDKIFGLDHNDVSASSGAKDADPEADFGESGVVVESEMDDRVLVKRKTFMLTRKEYEYMTDKLKAIKNEYGFDTEAEAMLKALEPYKGLKKVIVKKGAVKEIKGE